jgi:hypothetical protein
MQSSRRGFLSGLFRGAAVATVGIAAVGCVTDVAAGPDVGPDGATEILPRTPGLWYANAMPRSIPAVRASSPIAADWSTSKRAAIQQHL